MPTPHKEPLSIAAAVIVGLLSLSPFVVALDMIVPFLPERPVFGYMRSADLPYKVAWIALGPFGLATLLVLLRRPIIGTLLTIVFSLAYVPLALILWRHFTWGCWLAGLAVILAAIGAYMARRSNNSLKPNPLRGSA